ncbi:MAG: pitrilysin family protein [Candidatus Firestonebacteria bacterium]|nr:pitrilysin family protein [Candidatus Firestonebacteria bacterium]
MNKDTSNPIVAVTMFIKNGSSYETTENNGVTNLAFELLLKGTTGKDAALFSEEVESLGASLEAAGGDEFCTVSLVSVKKYFPQALALLSEAILTPAFSKEEFEKVRRNALSAIKAREDNNFEATYHNFKETFYEGHCYRLDKLGTEKALSKITAEEACKVYKAGLAAPRLVLAVSGDFPADIAELLERRFGRIQAKDDGFLKQESTEFRLIKDTEKTTIKSKAQSMLLLGYPAPSLNNPDFTAMKVLGAAIGGGMSSKLFNDLREKQGLAYEIGAFFPAKMYGSHFVFYAGTRKENIEKLRAGIFEQVEKIKAGIALSEEDVAAAKNYLIGNFYLDKQTNVRKAWYLGWYEIAEKGYSCIDGYAGDIAKVTKADINLSAGKYFFNNYVLTLQESK